MDDEKAGYNPDDSPNVSERVGESSRNSFVKPSRSPNSSPESSASIPSYRRTSSPNDSPSSMFQNRTSAKSVSQLDAKQQLTSASPCVTTRRSSDKLRAPQPTRLQDVLADMLLDLGRIHNFSSIQSRLKFVCVLVLMCSLICHNMNMESKADYFWITSKYNPFNVIFVKWGWLWTLVATVPFCFMTSCIYCAGHAPAVFRHMSRLLVATAIWWLCVNTFVGIERRTRVCSIGRLYATSEFDCVVAGGRWSSHDISGHCFIMIYSLLVMAEESRAFWQWGRLTRQIEQQRLRDPNVAHFLTTRDAVSTAAALTRFRPFIKVWFFVFLFGLSLVWYWCLFVTSLFYHKLLHKILGSLVGIGAWLVTYKFWYRLPPSPGLPGFGRFNYQG